MQYDYPDLSFFIQSVPIDPNDKSTVELYHDILNSKLEVIKEMQEQANKMNSKRFGDFNSVIMLSHPKSTGTLRLRSGDYSEHPAIDPNYLQDPEDVETLLRGLKFLEKLENTPTFLSFGMELMFAAPGCKKEIELGRADNFYRCLARNHGMTMFHPCCTAKMGANSDKMAVTDHRLRVYKVEGLRVADASVMPAITSANTQAPSYMIGEKASDMIKEDWKLI
ncbi:unnamed protein product [Clavelina lepadiformis]|uniref:Glucose-methanol-choline oxidoreductase C-terminal domain-containing protein n=1 Tax=Clavelina lepadiformis TaxID=159417 RepID=A0ABP0GVE9_CLALP